MFVTPRMCILFLYVVFAALHNDYHDSLFYRFVKHFCAVQQNILSSEI